MIDHVYEVLRNSNLKLTKHRRKIIEILYSSKEHHLDIDAIHALSAEDRKKRMSLATVYRTMELFEKIGVVLKISMEKSPSQYELIVRDQLRHHHLICLKCGLVQEISDSLTGEFKELIDRETGFQVKGKPMKIYGYCSKCKEETASPKTVENFA